eukprot:RCo010360
MTASPMWVPPGRPFPPSPLGGRDLDPSPGSSTGVICRKVPQDRCGGPRVPYSGAAPKGGKAGEGLVLGRFRAVAKSGGSIALAEGGLWAERREEEVVVWKNRA